jgi:Homeodomain-like domain
MNKKFVVRLSVEERGQLETLVAKGKAAARKLTRARILLKADCSSLGPAWSDERISDALDLGAITVHRVRRSFVEAGLEGTLVMGFRSRRTYQNSGDGHRVRLAP